MVKIIGLDTVLSTQQGPKQQVAKVKKENVTLLKFVEEYKVMFKYHTYLGNLWFDAFMKCFLNLYVVI